MQPAQIRPATGTTPDRHATAPANAGTPAARSPRQRPRWLIATIAAALAIIAFGAFFLIRWQFDEDTTTGAKADTAPPPCTLLNTELTEKIVPAGAIREDAGQCAVVGSNPQLAPKITLTVNAVPKQPKLTAAEAASQYVTQAFKDNGKRIDGVGDDAVSYEPANSGTIIILMRVNNIVVSLTASVSVQEKVVPAPAAEATAIVADIAQRLRNR